MSFSALFVGLLITLVGAVALKYYQVLANNLGSGTVSYERFKLYFLITCLIGIIVAFNLHAYIAQVLVSLFVI